MPPNFVTTASGIHVPTSANNGQNFALGLKTMADEFDAMINALLPIGVPLPSARVTTDLTVGDIVIYGADGRLIDRTVFAGFFAEVGHAFNGGVDPGANKVRIPDLRGRGWHGADTFGTAAGAAGRVTGIVRGTGGGEQTHALITSELAVHTHPASGDLPNFLYGEGGGGADNFELAAGTDTTDVRKASNTSGGAGSGTAHNNMGPFQAGHWIVRVA